MTKKIENFLRLRPRLRLHLPFVDVIYRMLSLGLIIVLVNIIHIDNAHAQGWIWAKENGGSGIDGWPVATDASGNVFVAGMTSSSGASSVSFGGIVVPNPDNLNTQTVVAKYDAAGNALWVKGIQLNQTQPVNIVTDPSGNLILLGTFYQDIQIDTFHLYFSGSTSSYLFQYFLVKFDPNGNVIWAKASGGGSGNITSFFATPFTFLTFGNIAADTAGNIFITGNYSTPVDSIGPYVVMNSDTSGFSDDIFVAKYDPAGNVMWATGIGGKWIDDALGITVSSAGNVYITGYFQSDSITVGPSIITNPYGLEIQHAFIAEFSSSGAPLWAEAGGGYNGASGVGLISDKSGNVYLTGGFAESSITFGPTTISRTCPYFSSGSVLCTSLFLIQISSGNNITWSKVINSPTNGVFGYSIALSSCGEVWVSGAWSDGTIPNDSVNIDGHILRTPDNCMDPIFIACYDLSGGVKGYVALQSGGDDQNGIACDPNGNLYVCSDFWNFNDFRLLVGSDTLRATGDPEQLYLAKYKYIKDFTGPDTLYRHDSVISCREGFINLSPPLGLPGPYQWNNGANSHTMSVDSSGISWVICSGSCYNSCVIDTFYVQFENIGFHLGNDTLVCNPITLTIPLSGVSYIWSDGSKSQNLLADHSGAYIATVIDHGCISSDTINVNLIDVNQNLNDTIVCMDEGFQLAVNANVPDGANVIWNTGSTGKSIVVSAPGYYWVKVTDGGCSGFDSMHVTGEYCDCWCQVPNCFTPNGDGLNDIFNPVIDPNCIPEKYSFSVYNRWGECVYSTNDRNEGWNGLYKGIPCDLGVYKYMVSFYGGKNNTYFFLKGDITLIR